MKFNVPAAFVFNKRPDFFIDVLINHTGTYSDGTEMIVCETTMSIWSISSVTNWVAVNNLIEASARKHLENIYQPKINTEVTCCL